MTDARLNEHQMRLLTEVLAGDRSDSDPDVTKASAGSDAFRESLAELRALQGRLEADGRFERELLAESRHAAAAADDPVVARTITELAGGPTAPGGRRPARGPGRVLAFSAVAAAAALLLVWALGGFGGPGGGGEPNDDYKQLGDKELKLDEPARENGRVRLTWSCSIPVTGYTVTVYDPADLEAEPLAESDFLDTGAWELEQTFVDDLPRDARWRVTARVRGRVLRADAPLR